MSGISGNLSPEADAGAANPEEVGERMTLGKAAVRGVFFAFSILIAASTGTEGHPLQGSRSSLLRQNHAAEAHEFTYLRSPASVKRFVRDGYLVRVTESRDLRLESVSYPYARPEVATFLERLASQHRRACSQPLVVTSVTRPKSRQPPNASPLSVHPTGMAADLRRSRFPRCRAWLERVLISLERTGVIEATRERYPPHYHVAVFPRQYESYVARLTGKGKASPGPQLASRDPGAAAKPDTETAIDTDAVGHRVRRGESLWKIARRYDTSVDQIRETNELSRNRIFPGQVLRIPVTTADADLDPADVVTAR